MASVTFAGSTLWNDASTGIDRVQAIVQPGRRRWVLRDLPRGQGKVAKNLGKEPSYVIVPLSYVMSSNEYNTLAGVWDGIVSSAGTLAIPPGQSYANVILLDWRSVRGAPLSDAGTIRYQWQIIGVWQQLR